MTTDGVAQVVLLTPEGRGAVASVLVAGPGATVLVEAMFHCAARAPLAAQPLERVLYGRWQHADTGEEVVVCRRTESQIEIHCHGGVAAARAIIDSLVERGCRQIDWREWIRQAVDDPIAAAAQIALARAPTERVATVLWDQHSGALRRALDGIATLTTQGDLRGAVEQAERLLAWAPLGRHLVEPWRVVLAGPPNVGKSSLINALVGYERAIVHATPGTTRDVVAAATAIEGWPVELTDTAGLHASHEPLESAGIALARARLVSADLVVLVFDASRPRSDDDEALAHDWPQALVVWNKCDLIAPGQRGEAPPAALLTSATGGLGLENLQREIGRRLVPRDLPPGEAVPFLAEQIETLQSLRDLLREGRSDAALGMLSSAKCWSRRPC